jgi:hypothetical protein
MPKRQTESFESIASLVDVQYKVEKLKVGRELRLIALGKLKTGISDYKHHKKEILEAGKLIDPVCAEVYARLVDLNKYLRAHTAEVVKRHAVWKNWARYVRGVSPMLLAKAMGRCDIVKLTTASKFRAHAGLRPDQVGRKKGEKLTYDPRLKSVLWLIGRQLRYADGAYYDVYRKAKDYYTSRCERQGIKIVPTPAGTWQCANCGQSWKRKKDITPCCEEADIEKIMKKEPAGVIYKGHLDMMAMRKMISLFGIHMWAVWREADGLPVPKPWILSPHAERLGHVDYIPPLTDRKPKS